MQPTQRGGLSTRVLPLLLPLALLAQPARADVVATGSNGFVVRVTAEVTAKPADAWKTMTSPAQWWSSQHTFSGDAANLTLDPVPGGCFCETLPRPDGAPATQKPGGVQHMRVIYVEPPRAMRLVGALGPLQSEALAATMTMTIKPTDTGSRILFEYVAGGYMRYKVEEIAPAVDRMLTAQITSLAGKLGPVAPAAAYQSDGKSDGKSASPLGPPSADPELPPAPSGAKGAGSMNGGALNGSALNGAENYRLPPAHGASPEVDPAPAVAPKAAAKPAPNPAAATPAAAKLPAKPAIQPVAKPVGKLTGKPVGKAAAKPATKPAPKAPNPDDAAHLDANAAFDAALGGSAKP